MKLEDVRRELRERAGAIKAFALTREAFDGIVAELGVRGVVPGGVPFGAVPDCRLFEVPVIFVLGPGAGQPEGVIV